MSKDRELLKKLTDNLTDYEKAKGLKLTDINRWEEGRSHHPESERMINFLASHDYEDHEDYFCWKTGGDGDNGEALAYQMDTYFEMKDTLHPSSKADVGEALKELDALRDFANHTSDVNDVTAFSNSLVIHINEILSLLSEE